MAIDAIAALKIAAPSSGTVAPKGAVAPGESASGFADALEQLVGAVDQSSGDANT